MLEWAQQALTPSALLVSDGLACFVSAGEWAAGHERVVVGVRKSSELERFHWVNTLLGNLKNARWPWPRSRRRAWCSGNRTPAITAAA
ncbi:transposase [Thiocystis minor]|uniref:transposase n=1 Tax=Thiocystis minor TaxID=61597 RepID=UPI003B835CAB